MTVPEEIEQLKTQIAQTTDERTEAELIVALLMKYHSRNNEDKLQYIDRLMILAEKLNKPVYKAWGLYELAYFKCLNGEYDIALNLAGQAFTLFEQIGNKSGMAFTHKCNGDIYEKQCNFPEALKSFNAALKLREETGDKQRTATCYIAIGNIYLIQGNYPEVLKNQSTALKICAETGDKTEQAQAYDSIGIVYAIQGNYPEAINSFFAGLKRREEEGDKQDIASSYGNLGIAYFYQGKYPEALENLFIALKLRKEVNDKHGIPNAYNDIANVYDKQGNYPDALKNHLLALKLKLELNDNSAIASSYNNIGTIYSKMRNYPEAIKNLSRALKFNQEAGIKQGIADGYTNLAIVYFEQGNYPDALKNNFAALKINEEIGEKLGIAISHHNIGNIYNKQGNYPAALNERLLALSVAEEMGSTEVIKDSALSLAQGYKVVGDFENALKYHEKYHAVESEILGEQAQKQLTNLSFMHNLEQKEKDLEIEQLRNVDLKKERDRSESLLLNILPGEVAEELKEKGTAGAKLFDDVTVLFTDFKDFTKVSERLTPQQLVDELHTCFSAFDHICIKHNIEKIKTVGDAYLAVSGLPQANSNHAADLVNAAIEIREFISERAKVKSENAFQVRIGVHSGSVVAGIVGVKKFAYDIWGDTVNTAARMEQNSEAGKINISQSTYELVKDKFNCEYRGEIEAKNKGKLRMYFVR